MNEQLLLSLVAPHWRATREKDRTAPAIGVQSDSKWQGPEMVSLDSESFRVVQCDSVLEARDVLETHGNGHLIMVTPLGDKDLGVDVAARLLRHKLLRIEPWEALRNRFNAKSFDAALLGKRALAEAAVESLAAGEPDPAPAGVLTAETIWKLVLGGRLGLTDAKPDARAWLEWTLDGDHLLRWRGVNNELKSLLKDWLSGYLGEWASSFLGCLESGYGQQAMAIGLALSVLRQEVPDGQSQVTLAQARGRLEQYTGGHPLSPQAQRVWAESAKQWAAASCANNAQLTEVTEKLVEADRLLEKTGALALAGLGCWSLAGFQQRLESFSDIVGRFVEKQALLADVERGIDELSQHQTPKWFARERALLHRAHMAARLCRWLQTPEETADDWEAAVGQYTEVSAWVDVARQAILGGNEPELVARRWSALFTRVSERRERQNRTFAIQLAKAVSEDHVSGPAVPIEDTLERVVAPWAKERVLLVVMDGMSYAVWHEIQCEVQDRTWKPQSWRDGVSLPPAISVLPSATGFSRCSLLCGRLLTGGQEVEKKGFAEHRALLAVSKAGFPPLLFHKDEVGSGSHNLSDGLRAEVRNENRRVVGVVVNVIDDSLTGPEQRLFHWTLDQIPILRTLLQEAEDVGRTVVITSDHGHVLDRGAVMRRNAGADRYRSTDSQPPAKDEVLISGRRVLDQAGQIIALASENVRYSSVRKLGYHGGATPQECLVPIAVLTPPERKLDGWYEATEATPLWWFSGSIIEEHREPKRVKVRREPPAPLFEGVPAVASDWISRLMRSETLADQLRVAGGRLEASRIEETVRALAVRNGVLMKAALAQKLDMPLLRIDGFLSNLQRVLNIDGYPVVSIDSSQTVRLDISLLKTQFEVE